MKKMFDELKADLEAVMHALRVKTFRKLDKSCVKHDEKIIKIIHSGFHD